MSRARLHQFIRGRGPLVSPRRLVYLRDAGYFWLVADRLAGHSFRIRHHRALDGHVTRRPPRSARAGARRVSKRGAAGPRRSASARHDRRLRRDDAAKHAVARRIGDGSHPVDRVGALAERRAAVCVKTVEVTRAAGYRARPRVRGGGRADPVRIKDVICDIHRLQMNETRCRAVHPHARAAGASARLAASAGLELGRRRAEHGAPALPGARRRARPFAVAGERAGPAAQHVARGRSAASRASQSSGDADDVPLLGVVRARAVADPDICDAGSPAKPLGARSAPHGHRRRSRRASRHARNRLGAQLPARPRRRARLHVAGHGLDDADGPPLDHRMAVGDAARPRFPTGLAPDFRFMPVPNEWADGTWRPSPRERSVAARGGVLRDADGRDAAAATKCLRFSFCVPTVPHPSRR